MGELTKMNVTMDADAWRKTASTAKVKALELIAGGDSADRLVKAAELLRAVDTFNGHANMMEMLDRDADTATIDAWDLTDEGFPGEVVPAT